MAALALAASVLLPWGAGCLLLRTGGWPRAGRGDQDRAPGAIALTLGYGYVLGIFLLTGWMRLLSATGSAFGRVSIGAPLVAVALAAIASVGRRGYPSTARMRAVAASILKPPLPGWERAAWIALLALLALRLITLGVEVGERPLYPWDAWREVATKARVWFEAGRMIPFVPADVWLAGAPGAYFDASPSIPGTVPLLQTWTAVALGRWDDSAINWPWLAMWIALALATYGTLRTSAVRPVGALAGAYLAASLPLVDTQVALAGSADLMLCGVYTLSALALHRWALHRDWVDGLLATLLAAACVLIKASGLVWALTLVPGLLVAASPRRGVRVVGWAFAVALLALLVLARPASMWPGLSLRLDYAPRWQAMANGFLLSPNWHLLWYLGVGLALVGARRLVRPPLAPLAAVACTGLAWVIVASAFGADVGRWFPDARITSRMTLQVAPIAAVLCVLFWREFTSPSEAARRPLASLGASVSDA